MAAEIEAQAPHRQREEDDDHDGQRRQQTPQEHEDHEGHQDGPHRHLVTEIVHRIADIQRLVAQQGDLRRLGDLAAFLHFREERGHGLAHAVDHGHGVFPRLAQERHVHAPLPVDVHDIVLDGRIVLDIADVADEDRPAVAHGDGSGGDVFDAGEGIQRMDLVLRLIDFHRPRGQHQVGFLQRLGNVLGAEAHGAEPRGIDIDHHLPVLAAEGVIDLHPFEPAQLVPHTVISDLIQILFAQAITGDGGQDHRQASRLAGQRKRILDPRREVEKVVGFQVHHVVDRPMRIGSRMEDDLQHAGPGNGARFLVLHPARQGRGAARRSATHFSISMVGMPG